MAGNGFHFIGVGLYSVPEASRLSRVSTWRIRRWLRGYTFPVKGGRGASPPVVTSTLPPIDGVVTLTFLDLLEVRLVDAFISAGVKWRTLREAHANAQAALGPYPFSRGRFVTDGRSIFEGLVHNTGRSDLAFVDIVTKQTLFRDAVAPYLATLKVSRDDGQATEWWPLGKNRRVVVDPARSFGQPIVSREGVPTATLVKAYKVEKSIRQVARWFEVQERSLRDAIEFESSLAAA